QDKNANDKFVREIFDRTPETIGKQVDFTKEYLVMFKWDGSGTDRLTYSVNASREGTTVDFVFTAGKGKDRIRPFSRLFAVSKNVDWSLDTDKNWKRLQAGTKITRAEDLPTYFAAPKEK